MCTMEIGINYTHNIPFLFKKYRDKYGKMITCSDFLDMPFHFLNTHCWIQIAHSLLRIFAPKFMRDIGQWLSCTIFNYFGIRVTLVSKMSWEVSLPLLFSGKSCVKVVLII